MPQTPVRATSTSPSELIKSMNAVTFEVFPCLKHKAIRVESKYGHSCQQHEEPQRLLPVFIMKASSRSTWAGQWSNPEPNEPEPDAPTTF